MTPKRAAALTRRHDQDHASVLASRAAKAVPPPSSWWAQPMLTWEQWSALAAERARQLNALSTTQHVTRKQGDR